MKKQTSLFLIMFWKIRDYFWIWIKEKFFSLSHEGGGNLTHLFLEHLSRPKTKEQTRNFILLHIHFYALYFGGCIPLLAPGGVTTKN